MPEIGWDRAVLGGGLVVVASKGRRVRPQAELEKVVRF